MDQLSDYQIDALRTLAALGPDDDPNPRDVDLYRNLANTGHVRTWIRICGDPCDCEIDQFALTEEGRKAIR